MIGSQVRAQPASLPVERLFSGSRLSKQPKPSRLCVLLPSLVDGYRGVEGVLHLRVRASRFIVRRGRTNKMGVDRFEKEI